MSLSFRSSFFDNERARIVINSNGIDSVVVRDAYEWLITWLVIETQRRYDQEIAKGTNNFTARSKSQVYRAAILSKAYGEVNNGPDKLNF